MDEIVNQLLVHLANNPSDWGRRLELAERYFSHDPRSVNSGTVMCRDPNAFNGSMSFFEFRNDEILHDDQTANAENDRLDQNASTKSTFCATIASRGILTTPDVQELPRFPGVYRFDGREQMLRSEGVEKT